MRLLRIHRFLLATCFVTMLLAASTTRAGSSEAPAKPVLAWPVGPFETRVSFDGALDPEVAKSVVGSKIVFEEKATEKESSADHKGTLNVTAAKLVDAGRTLVLTTDPHPRAGLYSLDLTDVRPLGATSGSKVSVTYTLAGIETIWESDDAQVAQPSQGWLARFGPRESQPPKQPGKWNLATLLTLPSGPVAVRLGFNRPVEVTLGGEEPVERLEPKDGADGFARFQIESTGAPAFFSVVVPTGPDFSALSLDLSFAEGESPATLNPMDPARTTLPWVPVGRAESVAEAAPPDLEGGDPVLGKAVFEGATGKCSACHKVRGNGAVVGPDLSGLVGRGRLEVYRDIADPSARIHPDFVSYTIARKDGTIVVGTLKSLGADSIVVTNSEAKATTIRRDVIEEIRPSATSIMPVGLVGALGEKNLRDLIAYLVTRPAR